MVARNVLSDLEAVATWPWLTKLAEVLEDHEPARRRLQCGHVGLALFLAGRWAAGSGKQLTSLLKHSGTWPRLRLAAGLVGTDLPVKAPTYDHLKSYRDRVEAAGGFGALLEDVKALLTEAGVEQAQAQGLLAPSTPDWDALDRGNVLAADGSVFQPASGVRVDANGTVIGSKADPFNWRSTGPRVVQQRAGKPGDPSGVPVEMVTVRSDESHTRIAVAVEEILGGNESAAAHRSLKRVIDAAGGGVHAVVYDRLLVGADIAKLLDLKVLPVVAMKGADKRVPSLRVPAAAARGGQAGKKGGPKTRVLARSLPSASHRTAGEDRCHHEVHAVDGAVVILKLGQTVTATSPPARRHSLTVIDTGLHRIEWIGRYVYWCGGVRYLHSIDFNDTTSSRSGGSALTNWVRPMPEADPQFSRLDGYRNDVESAWSMIKRTMALDGLASSYDPDHFVLDVVGAGVLVNALAWQEHVQRQQVAA